jgi:hypothetical protein
MHRPALVVVLIVAVVLAVGAPAWAHITPRPASVPIPAPSLHERLFAAAAEPELPWTALALLAAVALAALSRRRRVVVLTLVLVVGLFAFEAGVHSAHHLGSADDAARCVVSGMSSQLSADLIDATLDALLPPASEASVPALAAPAIVARVLAPDAGRAPPARSA